MFKAGARTLWFIPRLIKLKQVLLELTCFIDVNLKNDVLKVDVFYISCSALYYKYWDDSLILQTKPAFLKSLNQVNA